jgi:hypothetical protein
MGQYGNQPDFGTRGANLEPSGDADPGQENPGVSWDSAALYIGTGGDLYVDLVGGNSGAYYTFFKAVPSGTFLPIIVYKVWATIDGEQGTTCLNIVALY